MTAGRENESVKREKGTLAGYWPESRKVFRAIAISATRQIKGLGIINQFATLKTSKGILLLSSGHFTEGVPSFNWQR